MALIDTIPKDVSNAVNLHQTLADLNYEIHHGTKLFDYHVQHLDFLSRYAMIVNKRLNAGLNRHKLHCISLAHDLFKERSLNKNKDYVEWKGIKIPQNIVQYVRRNLDVLKEYDLDEYFNTDIQWHPLAAGIFLIQEFGMKDMEILYPIFFHSCPIIPVYETLDSKIQTAVDIIMLSDKLSSNYLKINLKETEVRCDLDQIVFGRCGNEFNYSLGCFIARLIAQGNSNREYSAQSTDYYHKRLIEINPFVPNKYSIGKLGGNRLWPRRNSPLWNQPLNLSKR